MAHWDTGRTLAGRYRVVRALGSGSAARAFLATDLVRSIDVVLKAAKRAADGPLLANELELLRGLYHPSLVTALDLFVENARPVIVCEWVRGVPLSVVTPKDLPRVARDLASALSFLHAMGIAHGDVKADNVLVEERGAKLLDLSAARRGAGLSRGYTKNESAPETEARGHASFASDVYALGRLLIDAGASEKLAERLAPATHESPAKRPTSRELAALLGADTSVLSLATLRSRFVGRGDALASVSDIVAKNGACAIVTGAPGLGRTRFLREARWRAALTASTFAREANEPIVNVIARAFSSEAPQSLGDALRAAESATGGARIIFVDDVDLLAETELAYLRALAARADIFASWVFSATRIPAGFTAFSREVALQPLGDAELHTWLTGTRITLADARATLGVPRAIMDLATPRVHVPAHSHTDFGADAWVLSLLHAKAGALSASFFLEQDVDSAVLEALVTTGRVVRVDEGFAEAHAARDPRSTALSKRAHALFLSRARAPIDVLVHASLAGDRARAIRAIADLEELAASPPPVLVRAARGLAHADIASARVFAAHVLERAGDVKTATNTLFFAAIRGSKASRDRMRLTLSRLYARKGDRRGLRVLSTLKDSAARVEETILLLKLGAFSDARDVAKSALALTEDAFEKRDLEVSLALAESWLGDLEGPIARLVALASQEDGTPRARFRAKSACATVLLRAGDARSAEMFYEGAQAEARAFGLDDLALSVTVNLAVAYHQDADYGRAQKEYSRAIDLARATDARATLAIAQLYIARLYADLGLDARASAALESLDPAILSPFHAAVRACLEAEVRVARSDIAEARTLADAAIAACSGAPREHAEASLVRLAVAIRSGERELARDLAFRLDAEIRALGADDLASRRAELAAKLASSEGRPDEAIKLARTALELAERTKKRRLIERAHALLAEVYEAEGAPAAATPHRESSARLREELWAELPSELRPEKPRAERARVAVASEVAGAFLVQAILRIFSAKSAEDAHASAVEEAITATRAERGFLLLRKHEDDEPFVASAKNVDQEAIKKPRNKYGRTIAKRAIDSGESILLFDAQDDSTPQGGTAHRLGLRSVLCVPLFSDGKAIGALYLDNRFANGAFTGNDERAVRSLVDALSLLLVRFAKESALLARVTAQASLVADASSASSAHAALPEISTAIESPFPEVATRSSALVAVLSTLSRVLDVDVPVLIRGESGTGKELVARAVHAHSKRKKAAFLAINCGALPENLLEAELFGYVRGAFTGATQDKTGLFVAASGGVIFLDELGEMPPSMQVKLLRVLQEHEVRPVGSTRDVKVDVRVVSATNRDLKREVAEGRFREDLYYRVAVVDVELPPLRERPLDIGFLADAFMDRLRRQTGIPRVLSLQTRALLAQHRWPGNVRELENAITRAFFLSDGDLVTYVPGLGEGKRARTKRGEDERKMILDALAREDWNVRKVARTLGIPRATFYRRLERYGIARDPNAI